MIRRNREYLENLEEKNLASYAGLSKNSGGRKYEEAEDLERRCFQRDKERVIHSKAFRRLDGKTQVFCDGTGDHFRLRLTHSLEVAQVSRGIARLLGLNEDLCEVIALSHDLGHPPYGHAGEEALNEVMQEYGLNFEHNQQSLRIVDKLEKMYPHFEGLNLSKEVLEGLIKHQTAFDQSGKIFEIAPHLEAQVVNFADEIAYTNHDVDDALRSKLVTLDQLKKIELWNLAYQEAKNQYGDLGSDFVLSSRTISKMLNLMIQDLLAESQKNLELNKIASFEDVLNFKGPIIGFSKDMKEKVAQLRQFLFKNFYLDDFVIELAYEGQDMITDLFGYFMENPYLLDELNFERDKDEKLEIAVKDYIAGMTDQFLRETYARYIEGDY